MIDAFLIVIIVIGSLLGLIIFGMMFFSGQYRRAPSDKALLIFSKRFGRQDELKDILTHGGRIVLPFIQRTSTFPTDIRTLEVAAEDVVCDKGRSDIMLDLKAVTQFKPGGDEERIRNAVDRMFDMKNSEIDQTGMRILEDHMRRVGSGREAWRVFHDRDQFAEDVMKSAETDMKNAGFTLRSFVIKDIYDKIGFMNVIVKVKTEEVLRRYGKDTTHYWDHDPTPPDQQIALGIYQCAMNYLEKGSLERCLKHLWSACLFDPDNEDYKKAYSEVTKEIEEIARKENLELEEYLQIKEDKRWAAKDLNDEGMKLFHQKRYSEAIPYFEKALKLDPAQKWNSDCIDMCRKRL